MRGFPAVRAIIGGSDSHRCFVVAGDFAGRRSFGKGVILDASELLDVDGAEQQPDKAKTTMLIIKIVRIS